MLDLKIIKKIKKKWIIEGLAHFYNKNYIYKLIDTSEHTI